MNHSVESSIPRTLNAVGSAGLKPIGADIEPPEIQREANSLEKSIQQTFETSRLLAERLTPVLRHYPSAPQDENKCPAEAMSDLASTFNRNRKSVDGINASLREIIDRLAL